MNATEKRHRAPLLANGLFFLGLSFLLTALADSAGGGPAAVAWLQSATWWVGLICIAGHVLRLVLAPAEPAVAPAEDRDWYAG